MSKELLLYLPPTKSDAFLPFFQILSYQITEDTHKWKKHPLMDEMKRLAGAKTLNYESSPLRRDMPQ